ncbi:hypothetical protein OG625_07785 [Streptomyces sp. NBC_01351]|uniref:hypothetical protein n=1 Tax=Streptomyces sp. NBC_01351 TaxID=2903833 RepID=UPI002E34E456|nr:hypothetical protein [Streptomyces sp. NBC_01351]
MQHVTPETRAKIANLFADRRQNQPAKNELTALLELYVQRVLIDPDLTAHVAPSTPYVRVLDQRSVWEKTPETPFAPAVANIGGDIDIHLDPEDFGDLREFVTYKTHLQRDVHLACVDLKKHPTVLAVLAAVELTRRAYEKNRAGR